MSSRSYGQFCGLARALDIVGERWSLLIVRELLVAPARYSELAAALPVATNLLAQRLRTLTDAGVVEKRLDPDRDSVVYALTPWGEQLREAVDALVRWSTPLMKPGARDDTFRAPWLSIALRALLVGRTSRKRVSLGVETVGELLTVELDRHGPSVVLRPDAPPRTTFRADPQVVLGLAAQVLSVDDALALGQLEGNRDDLAAVFGGKAPAASPR